MLEILFYITLILIFILLVSLFKVYFKKNNSLTIIVTCLCTLIIFLIILDPKLCITSTISGLKLFVYNVFPSVFVFITIFNIIFNCGGVNIYSKFLGYILCKPFNLPRQCSIVLIISLMCGYPLGAKFAIHLYEDGGIDKETTEKLLYIASNSSPLFVIGSVGTIMLGNEYLGYLILIISNLSVVIVGFLTRGNGFKGSNNSVETSIISNKNYSSRNIGEILKKSIENAILSSMNIGGFIVFFSMIISLLNNYIFSIIPNKILKATLNGLIEVTLGCNEISKLSYDINLKFLLTLFIVSFSGLSIISQIYSIIYRHKFSIKKYINYKLIHALTSISLGFIYIKIFPLDNSVFNSLNNNPLFGVKILFIAMFILLILPLTKLFRNFHIS
ncbi:MAG: sporulation integral membrane protein YlbJ [Clostridiaceae bacterium]